MEINLPVHWVYTKYKGPDFDVHYFSDPDKSDTLSIYIGHHPNLALQNNDSIVKSEHFIGNKKAVFQQGNVNGKTYIESLVGVFYEGQEDSGVSSLMLHVMITESTSGFIDTVFDCLKTLRIQKKESTGKGNSGDTIPNSKK